jgi:molecular chaperone IbpA
MVMNLNPDPFWRSSIGFDRLLDLMDESLRYQPKNNYPPYNIGRTAENAYRIRSQWPDSSPIRST